jgi:hypothetical protein
VGEIRKKLEAENKVSFHSINIPSEWELMNTIYQMSCGIKVSIQLISPASGNPTDFLN